MLGNILQVLRTVKERFSPTNGIECLSQWPRGLRRKSATTRMLRLWFRIPPGAWIFVCCECCVLSGRGLCDGLITRPEESYRRWCFVACDLETSSRMRRPWPALGCSALGKKMELNVGFQIEGEAVVLTFATRSRKY